MTKVYIDIDKALVDEYERAAKAYLEVNQKFEQLYRVQDGF